MSAMCMTRTMRNGGRSRSSGSDCPRQESNGGKSARQNKGESDRPEKVAHNPAHFPTDPRLAAIVDAWPRLAEAVRDDLARRATEADESV